MIELFISFVRLYPFVFLALVGFVLMFVVIFWMWHLAGEATDGKTQSQIGGVALFTTLGQLIVCGSITIATVFQNLTGKPVLNSKGEVIFGSETGIWLFYILWFFANMVVIYLLRLEKKKHPERYLGKAN